MDAQFAMLSERWGSETMYLMILYIQIASNRKNEHRKTGMNGLAVA